MHDARWVDSVWGSQGSVAVDQTPESLFVKASRRRVVLLIRGYKGEGQYGAGPMWREGLMGMTLKVSGNGSEGISRIAKTNERREKKE